MLMRPAFNITLGPAYYEFDYDEHLALTSRLFFPEKNTSD